VAIGIRSSRPLRASVARTAATTLAVTGVVAVASAALSGCGSGSTNNKSAGPTQTTSERAAAHTQTTAISDASALRMSSTAVSVATLKKEIGRLYSDQPALKSYVAQGTTYTTHSRNVVFHACTLSGAGATSEEVQSGRLDACAPLIFYLYSFGASHHASQAISAADALFSFAADDVDGPIDSTSDLATLLRSWGLTVETTTPAAAKSKITPQEMKLLSETARSILSESGVHMTITGYTQHGNSLAERIVVDMGKQISKEQITQPTAHAEIDVTPTAAFLSGNTQGLTTLIGLTSKETLRVGSRWVEAKKGSKTYSNFKAEDTLASLPSSIFPAASDAVALTHKREHGRTINVLTWTATISNSAEKLTERLEITDGAEPLPIEEGTTAGSDRQTVSFARWGDHVTVATPANSDVVSYAALAGK
jgi:hypothetical protein